MEILQSRLIQCPWCWEQIELVVDCSVIEQEYVEDCSVCCSPIVVSVLAADNDELVVEARME
jgi:hypothetical protein